jgi:diguanylate cyclase (GGDEF)-like protein
VPALLILTTAFVLHEQRKRHEVRARAITLEAHAREATLRVAEMERLVTFGHALARSLDAESIREAAAQHLPTLAGGRSVWTMVRTGATFASLTVSGGSTAEEREQVARRVLDDSTPPAGPGAGDIGFPMVVAGEPIGVLGVAPEPSLTEHQRSVLAAAAALLAVSLKNAELFREVRESSVRDVLTGCVNRRHAMEVMDAELRRARRSRLPISLVMFDLDHFKAINDSAGHLGGDAVLASIGQRMHAVLRGSDLKCRYGGEEFLILLPDTPLAGAQRVAETLRKDFEANPVRWNGVPLRVTASFGLAAVLPGEIDPLAVIARADAALYSAKQAGRNCVRIAEARVAIV